MPVSKSALGEVAMPHLVIRGEHIILCYCTDCKAVTEIVVPMRAPLDAYCLRCERTQFDRRIYKL